MSSEPAAWRADGKVSWWTTDQDGIPNHPPVQLGEVTGASFGPEPPCPFCEIAAGRAPATIVREWPDALAFTPLNPVVEGHTLVIPRAHVPDFATDPYVSAVAMYRAAELEQRTAWPMNVITSRGREATQTVRHLHLHLVPRSEGDGLLLPWTDQALAECRSET